MRNLFLRAIVSGAAGSLLSTLALAGCGWRELGDPYAPLNGPSQWLFGRQAALKSGASLKYTLSGYLIHHAMSVFWALVFERIRARGSAAPSALLPAATTSAVACFVDYQLTPKRLTPGFERRLSRKSLAVVYVAFAIGLAAGAVLQAKRRR
jgi:hypothetical protein